jgi:hypothetical protein
VPQIPDISDYKLHRTVHDVDLEGIVVPGLTGQFFERDENGRVATVGCYTLKGEEIFMAWGYRDDAHCSWTAYRQRDGWTAPHRGCPRPRAVNEAIARPGAEES